MFTCMQSSCCVFVSAVLSACLGRKVEAQKAALGEENNHFSETKTPASLALDVDVSGHR
jgi:hypothetical protein